MGRLTPEIKRAAAEEMERASAAAGPPDWIVLDGVTYRREDAEDPEGRHRDLLGALLEVLEQALGSDDGCCAFVGVAVLDLLPVEQRCALAQEFGWSLLHHEDPDVVRAFQAFERAEHKRSGFSLD